MIQLRLAAICNNQCLPSLLKVGDSDLKVVRSGSVKPLTTSLAFAVVAPVGVVPHVAVHEVSEALSNRVIDVFAELGVASCKPSS